nr:elongation factor EF-1 alpha [Hypothenemus hampei]
MARHRDVRNMDYEDEYDGYDDVYGHSVDEDFCISPSNRQFIYNRENSRESKLDHSDDIQEADEVDELTDTERAQLNSCIDEVTNVLGTEIIPRNELVDVILKHKFNVEKVINSVLEDKKDEKKSGTTTRDKASFFKTPTVVEPAPSTTTKLVSVVKGFNLPQSDTLPAHLPIRNGSGSQSPSSGRGQSPTSGRETPLPGGNESETEPRAGRRETKVDPEAQYKTERGNGKEHLYMVVIGHVDAGKSTLMGRLLCELGQVNKKTMHKYAQESRKLGKQSFYVCMGTR